MRLRLGVALIVAAPSCVQNGEVIGTQLPGSSLDGFTVYEPDELRNDPRAGDPSYVFLDQGRDAIYVRAAPVPLAQAATLTLGGGARAMYPHQWGDNAWDQGVMLDMDEHVRYVIEADDFENEFGVHDEVDVEIAGETATPVLILVGSGAGGVAQDVAIRIIVDGVAGERSPAFAVEVRDAESP